MANDLLFTQIDRLTGETIQEICFSSDFGWTMGYMPSVFVSV
jgi:hypothetical protein